MARAKSFDTDTAIAAALAVFEAKGYHAAALSDLMAATGLSKSSLYGTFGSKHALFLEALALHTRRMRRCSLERLASDPDTVRGLTALAQAVRDAPADTAPGAFLARVAAEIRPSDRVVQARVRAGLSALEEALAAHLTRGQAAGRIRADIAARTLARALWAGLLGLWLQRRAGAPAPTLDALTEALVTQTVPPPSDPDR